MKATITRPDGTRIEAEGTPEEIARLAQPHYVPVQACTCWAGLCSLHTMRTAQPVNPWPWFTLGTLTSDSIRFTPTNTAGCAGNPTSYWIATV